VKTLIEASFARSRTVLLFLVLLVVAGIGVYQTIPKEADPDVQIPVVYVSMNHDGISPEDAERLLVRPVEQELEGLEGVKEITSIGSEGHASVSIEFETGVDIDRAKQDVRDRVDKAKGELPADTDEPLVEEVNIALFPVLVVTLSGEVPERTLLRLAENLRDEIEGLSNVLEVDLAGDRDEVLEVLINPERIENYGLELESVLRIVDRNNRLVAAGALDSGAGRFPVKVPGVFASAEELMNLPLKVSGDAVVRIGDVAEVRRTFKDPEGFARVDGRPALALEVKKRIGANIIDTIAEVREVVAAASADWPAAVEVGFSQDKSDDIKQMLSDLQNNVLAAVLLVMIVIVAALGLRTALLVGFAVPGSFLTAILVLGSVGLTINIVVLFALILAVGMLVDGAIVVTELADRKMAEGVERREAYKLAAKRMAWPITASTMTTLAAFLPLMFWPGIVGEFMWFLPVTLVATLAASLAMALVFVPNLGALIGRAENTDPAKMKVLSAAEGGDLRQLGGFLGWYVRLLDRLVRRPGTVAAMAVVVAVAAYTAYGAFGRGVEFFPEVEPQQAQLHVHARGDFSIRERDALVREVENRILGVDGIEQIYTRTALSFRAEEVDEDVIGTIQMQLAPWDQRRPAAAIIDEIRERTDELAGIRVEPREAEAGPPVGKPVQLQIASKRPQLLDGAVERVREKFESMDGLVEISDSRPIPGIEWRLKVDREQASRFGTDIAAIGATVQLVTNGAMIGTYRPDDAEEELDIRVRYPDSERYLGQFDRLVVNTGRGPMPISTFVEREPAPKNGDLVRVDGRRAFTVGADVAPGVLADDKVRELRSWLADQSFDPAIAFTFKGEDEEQQAARAFLSKAFAVALFLIAIILVTQFNSFYQAFLILSAVIFSTVGVLLGLLVVQEPFGIIMSGIGVIALAGIVVNNNIVLIDTYNELLKRGFAPLEAVLRTGAQRLRPVLLTTITTILGLMPMVLRLNIDIVGREITAGGPSTDWWAQLATAVAGGLAFATLLTLVLTPCLIMLGVNTSAGLARLRRRIAVWRRTRRGRDEDVEGALQPAE